jgi:hypothetical protein
MGKPMPFTFLMCSERSGSNLITKLFNAHSEICGPSTKHLFNPVIRNLFRYEDLSDQNNWHALIKDIHTLLSADFSIWKKAFTFSELHELAPCGDISALLKQIFLAEASTHGKQHLFIKENHLYEFLPFLLINFPDAKYIYQTRDPRDMALSWKKNKNHPGGIVQGAKQWAHDQKKFLCNYQVLHSQKKATLIKYEDLISNPNESLQALSSYLGFEFQDSMLNFHDDQITQLNAQKQESWSNLKKPIISNNSTKYIEELSADEISIIEKICHFEMNALDYKPVNSKINLAGISALDIHELEEIEASRFPAQQSKGALKNMEAKRNFYQHEKLS